MHQAKGTTMKLPTTARPHRMANWPTVLLGVCVFVAMLICYTQVIPTLPFDSDDWELVNTARSGLPSFAAFNPARVLPETLMPLAGYAAAYLIRPLTGSYLDALMLAAAIPTALMVALYGVLFYRLLTHRAELGRFASVTATLVFLLAHFTVLLRNPDVTGVPILLGSFNYTCFFYYVIPSLLCACLVMTLALHGGSFDAYGGLARPTVRVSLLVLALYLAVFSNLFSSYVLAAWCGGCLLVDLTALRREAHEGELRAALQSYVKRNGIHLLVIVLWLASLVFEIRGGRAGNFAAASGINAANLAKVGGTLRVMAGHLNRRLIAMLLAATLAYLAFVLRHGSAAEEGPCIRRRTFVWALLIDLVLSWAFVLLLTTYMAAGHYLVRSDVLLGLAFPLLLLSCGGLAEVLDRHPQLLVGAAFVLYLMVTDAVVRSYLFQQPNSARVSAQAVRLIDEDILRQVSEADQAGETHLVLHVPAYPESDVNWPQSTYMGDPLSITLYKHRFITHGMVIECVADPQMNERYLPERAPQQP